jgi:hypothetical protein
MIKNVALFFLTAVTIMLLIVVFDISHEKIENEITESSTLNMMESNRLNLPDSYSRNEFNKIINETEAKYSWVLDSDNEFYHQMFFGRWKVIDMMPVEINVPSTYSGFDENDIFRGQDLIDNIVGQEIFFGGDYIENQGIVYELTEGYTTYGLPLFSEDTIIGCNTAKELGITGDYFSIVFFSVSDEEKKEEGKRNFASLNQLYLKDINTIYASVDGCITFKLQREEP